MIIVPNSSNSNSNSICSNSTSNSNSNSNSNSIMDWAYPAASRKPDASKSRGGGGDEVFTSVIGFLNFETQTKQQHTVFRNKNRISIIQ